MKGLELERHIKPSVFINMDESLALLLLKNLISNANRHNIPNGKISIELTKERLTIRNTGNPPSIPTEELFGRFKKGNQSLNSIGIGLAITKKISSLYEHKLYYTYENGWHTLEMIFKQE
jgi:two-component system, OmpR family, sensor kinase